MGCQQCVIARFLPGRSADRLVLMYNMDMVLQKKLIMRYQKIFFTLLLLSFTLTTVNPSYLSALRVPSGTKNHETMKFYLGDIITSKLYSNNEQVSLEQLLLNLKYPPKNIPKLLTVFEKLFIEIDFASFKKQLELVKNIEQLKEIILNLHLTLKRKGYLNIDHPHPIIKQLGVALTEENIFEEIERSKISRNHKKRLNGILVHCATISQLTYILLTSANLNVKAGTAPSHMFVLIKVSKNCFLMIDFAKGIVKDINLSDYYQKEGGYFVLKKNLRIPWANLVKLQKYDAENKLKMNEIIQKGSEKELLHLFYFCFRETKNYGCTPGIYNNLSVIYAVLRKYDKALKYCQEAIEINPNESITYTIMATIYGKLGKKYLQSKYIQKAIKLNPNSADAFIYIGGTYYELYLATKNGELKYRLKFFMFRLLNSLGKLSIQTKKIHFLISKSEFFKTTYNPELAEQMFVATNNYFAKAVYLSPEKFNIIPEEFRKYIYLDLLTLQFDENKMQGQINDIDNLIMQKKTKDQPRKLQTKVKILLKPLLQAI